MNPYLLITIAVFAAGLFAPPARELAYLDPGSGSFIIQLLIAGAVGAAFAIRMYWKKIKASVLEMMGKAPEEAPSEPNDPDA